MSHSGNDTHTNVTTVGRSAVVSDQTQSRPAAHRPAIPLPPGTLYHFSVLYNHARSVHSRTTDTERSLAWTRRAVEELELRGLVNSYYHDRDCPGGQGLGLELGRVIKASRVTVLLLSPGFVRDCWPRYCLLSCFKQLLLNGTFLPYSSSTPSAEQTYQASRFGRSAYTSMESASSQSTNLTSVMFPSAGSSLGAPATDSSAIVLVALGLQKDELPQDLQQKEVIAFAHECDQDRGAWAQLTDALLSALPQSEAYVKAAARAAEELAHAHGATLVAGTDVGGARPGTNETPSPEGPGRRAAAAAAAANGHSHPAPICHSAGTTSSSPSLGNRIASPLPALSTSGSASISERDRPISTPAYTGSHPINGSSPVTAGPVTTGEDPQNTFSRASAGRETACDKADDRRESLPRPQESNSISTEDSVPHGSLILSADLSPRAAVSTSEILNINSEGVSHSRPRAGTRQRHSDGDGDGNSVNAAVAHQSDDALLTSDVQGLTKTSQDEEQANETEVGMFSEDAADGGNTQPEHEVKEISARIDLFAGDQYRASPRHRHLTSEDGKRNLNIEDVNQKETNSVSLEEVKADGIDNRQIVFRQDDTKTDVNTKSQFNSPEDTETAISHNGTCPDSRVEKAKQHTDTDNVNADVADQGQPIVTPDDVHAEDNNNEHLSFISSEFEEELTKFAARIDREDNFTVTSDDDVVNVGNKEQHVTFKDSRTKAKDKEFVIMSDDIEANVDTQEQLSVSPDDTEANVSSAEQLTISPKPIELSVVVQSGVAIEEIIVTTGIEKSNLNNIGQVNFTPRESESEIGSKEQLSIVPQDRPDKVDTKDKITFPIAPVDIEGCITNDRYIDVRGKETEEYTDNKEQTEITLDEAVSMCDNKGKLGVKLKVTKSDLNKEDFINNINDDADLDSTEQLTCTTNNTETSIDRKETFCIKPTYVEASLYGKEKFNDSPEDRKVDVDQNGQSHAAPEDKVEKVDANYKDEFPSVAAKCMVADVDMNVRLDVTPENTVRQDYEGNSYVEKGNVCEERNELSTARISRENSGAPPVIWETTGDVSSDHKLFSFTSLCLHDQTAADTTDSKEPSKLTPGPSSQTDEAVSMEDKALDEGNVSDNTETSNVPSMPASLKASQSKQEGGIFHKKTTEGTCSKGDVETAVLDRLAQTGIRRQYEFSSSQNQQQEPVSTEPLLPVNGPQSEPPYTSDKAENILLNRSSFSDAIDTTSDSIDGDSVTLQHQVNTEQDLSCAKPNRTGDDFTNETLCCANIPALEQTVKGDDVIPVETTLDLERGGHEWSGTNDQESMSATREVLTCDPDLFSDATANTHSNNSKRNLETTFIFQPGAEYVCIEDKLDQAAHVAANTVSLADSVCADQQQHEPCPSYRASQRSQENNIIVNLPTSIPIRTETIVSPDLERQQPERKISGTPEDSSVNEINWVTSLEDNHNLSITIEDAMPYSLTTSDYGTLSPRPELNSGSDLTLSLSGTSHSSDSTLGTCPLTILSSSVVGGDEFESSYSMNESRFESNSDYSSVGIKSGMMFTTTGELTEDGTEIRMHGEASVLQSDPLTLGHSSLHKGFSLTAGNVDAVDVDNEDKPVFDNEDKPVFTGDSHQVGQDEEKSAKATSERESSKYYHVEDGTKQDFQQKSNQLKFPSSLAGKDTISSSSEESKENLISDNLLDIDGKAAGSDIYKSSENQLKMVGAYNLSSTNTNDENSLCEDIAWETTDVRYRTESDQKDASIRDDNETVIPPAVLPEFSTTGCAQHPEEQIGGKINGKEELDPVAAGSTRSRRSSWTYEDIDKGWMTRHIWAPLCRVILHALTRSELPYF